jgi:4-amino-4-deoxy-L-arabinose transferase-like glycosyltransferase
LLAALCAALFLPGAFTTTLMEPEEARCALVVEHMTQTGQYFAPRLNGKPYYDKPAPYFALAAVGKGLTGGTEFGGRLVSMLLALAAVLATFYMVRADAGTLAGLLAGAMLASSAYFCFYGRYYRMDLPFAAFMWGAVCCFRICRNDKFLGLRQAARWLAFYACCAAAAMMKGPAGLVLPMMIVGLYCLVTLNWRELARMAAWSVPGLILFSAIMACWYVPTARLEPKYFHDFVNEFLIRQNFGRYAEEAIGGHTFPAVVYIPLLLAALLPWTIYLPGAIVRTLRFSKADSSPQGWHGDVVCRHAMPAGSEYDSVVCSDTKGDNPGHGDKQRRHATLLLWIATLLPLAFFMAAKSRLVGYILPCVPPLATLVALPVARWLQSSGEDKLYDLGAKVLRSSLPILAVGLAMTEFVVPKAFAAVSGEHLSTSQWLTDFHRSWLDAWIVLPLAAATAAAIAMHRLLAAGQKRRAMFVAFAGWAALLIFVSLHTGPRIFDQGNCRTLANAVQPQIPPDGQLVCFLQERFTFPLYCGRPQALLVRPNHPEEIKEFHAMLDSGKPVFALVPNAPVARGPGRGTTTSAPTDPIEQLREVSDRSWTRVAGDESFSVWRSGERK